MPGLTFAAVRRAWRDPVYANGIALVLNSGTASALGFLFWLVIARRYSSAEFGWGAAVVSASTLAALIGKAGFDAAIIRYGPSSSVRVLRKLVAQAALASVLLTAVVSGIVLALADTSLVTSLAPLRAPPAAIGFLALACGTVLAWVFDAFFIAEQTALYTLYRNMAFNLVKLVAPFAIAVTFASFAVPLSWGAGLAVSVLVAIALVPVALRRRRPAATVPPPSRAEVALYSAKNYVLNVSEFLPSLLLPILVLEMMGPVANARFFLAWTIASVGFLGSKAIAQSSFAALVREGRPHTALSKGARLAMWLLAPLVVFLLVFAPLLLRLFGQGGHADAILLLRLLALSFAPVTVTNLYLSYLKARQAGWELTILPAATLLVTIGSAIPALTLGMSALGWLWLGVQTLAAGYAGARLTIMLKRNHHGVTNNMPRIGRRAHEG